MQYLVELDTCTYEAALSWMRRVLSSIGLQYRGWVMAQPHKSLRAARTNIDF